MKQLGYDPDRFPRLDRFIQRFLIVAGILLLIVAMAVLAKSASGQVVVGDPRHLLTVEALSKVQPSPEPSGIWLGAVYRRNGQPVFFFRPEEGDVALLGVKLVDALPRHPDGLSYPFVADPRIEALPWNQSPWGWWRLPDLPKWYVYSGETALPLTVPAVVQPAFIRWGPPITLRIGQPLLWDP